MECEVEGPGKGWFSHHQILQYSWKISLQLFGYLGQRDLSEINRGGGNIELRVGNEVTHLSNRNEISLPSPWA